MNAPKPAATATGQMPRLTRSRASYWANIIVAGVVGAGALGMLAVGVGVTL